jgi:glycosyltransferase involved in cell wall biosynthesis
MRIGIDALFEDSQTGTGGLTYLRNLVREIGLLGGDDKFVVFVLDSAMRKLLDFGYDNMEVRLYGQGRFGVMGRLWMQHLLLAHLARKLKLDVILCPGNIASVFHTIPVALVVQNRLQYTPIGSTDYWLQPVGVARTFYKMLFGRLSLLKARSVLTVSSDSKDLLIRSCGVRPDKIGVVPLGVDACWFTASPQGDTDGGACEGYILGVGRLLPSKNHETLVRAVAAYNKRVAGSPRKLLIVGDDFHGRRDYLLNLARKLEIADLISIVGSVPYEKIPPFYQRAAVYVHLSYVESFGFPVLEAMACGTPVIASDRTSLPEVTGNAGILVNPDDLEAVVRALELVLTRPSLRNALIAKGMVRARELSWRRTAQGTLDALRAAVKSLDS